CDGAGRRWSDAEAGALDLAAQVMQRVLAQLPADSLWARALERWRRQRPFEQAAKACARLAHDLGNMLTGLLGFSELSLRQTTPGTPAHRFTQEVCQGAQDGAAWVRKLQCFSRRKAAASATSHLAAVL